jgi:hypothetical protein
MTIETSMNKLIHSLKANTAAGIDGISADHLIWGKSPVLCHHLASVYSAILSWNVVPRVFNTGIIVPILKKASLDPNQPSNYRPVTISCVHSKLIETLLIPDDTVNNCQFGFREKRGTSFGCALLNDIQHYFTNQGSPLYICSLDAEKCFDRIWHAGLMFKLWNKLPLGHWLLLYKWYSNTYAKVRWNSAYLFNIFIDDLIQQIQNSDNGTRIGNERYNCFAYADDINLFSATIPGLQNLINICKEYANVWRFRFGINKTKCMISGKVPYEEGPSWTLGDHAIENVSFMEILGSIFTNNCKSKLHVDKRIKSTRQCYYSLRPAGMCYPGLNTTCKAYLWKSACLPTLTYGCESMNICKADMKRLNNAQGCTIKNLLGLGKRSHHSNLLSALGLPSTEHIINRNILSFYHNVFRVSSPTIYRTYNQQKHTVFLS